MQLCWPTSSTSLSPGNELPEGHSVAMHHCIRLLLHELCARKEEVWKSNCKKHTPYKVERLLQSIVEKTQYVCIQRKMKINKKQHVVA